MRKFCFLSRMLVLVGCMISTSQTVLSVVNWHNDPAISASVFNDNIDIQGVNHFVAPISVVATTQDISMNISADSIITSSQPLYLYTANNHNIIFNISHDLTLTGSVTDFLITHSGRGTAAFTLLAGQILRFTKLTGSGAAGAYYYQIMNTANDSGTNFFGFNFPTIANTYVQVGPQSGISFAAPTPVDSGSTEVARIFWGQAGLDTNAGRFVLQLEDASSFIIEGSYITTLTTPTLADIDVTRPAGLRATILFFGAGGNMVVNNNATWTQLMRDPFYENNYTSIRHGFVLGAHGEIQVSGSSYLDYVVTKTNQTLDLTTPLSVINNPCQRFINQITKDRNAAALIVDGNTDPLADKAQITLFGNSAIYFRSAVDCLGVSTITGASSLQSQVLTFTVDPNKNIATEGTILFDVEGMVDITGSGGTNENVLNVLSLQVTPTGGSVFIEGSDTAFPLRTYARDANGEYIRYGSGCFFFNNRANFINVFLQHSDENHAVYENNIVAQSAPTYVGGDSLVLNAPNAAKEHTAAFYNSGILVHTDLAATGMTFLVPNNNAAEGNTSALKFYFNGRCLDQGTGRQFVLGTEVGALASDFAHIINRDAQLDIMQDVVQTETASSSFLQTLQCIVAPNNQKITEGLTEDISGQFGVNSIFLGYASNESIGTPADVGTNIYTGATFPLVTFPTLAINGDFFAFSTQGGTLNQPSTSSVTGEGGMFVDRNGEVTIGSTFRAWFGEMVTKSRNAIIDLPKEQCFWAPRVGIAQWQLDLSVPTQTEVINANTTLSDYTLDWKNVIKDWCNAPINIPYELPYVPAPGQAPLMTNANLLSMPVIRGSVDQMQVKNSRVGDQAQLLVDGGLVRELVFLNGADSGVAPTGLLVVQNNAIVGLGTAHRNVDSLDASVKLGINGITLVANGNGEIRLNEDTLIDNVCHVLTGTAFGITQQQSLVITSDVPRELRVKSDGVIDLTQFNTGLKRFVISGKVVLVMEPGAKMLLNGGVLEFSGQAIMKGEPFISAGLPVSSELSTTDSTRVKVIGNGSIRFTEGSQLQVFEGVQIGVETDAILGITNSHQFWSLTDDAQVFIGSEDEWGGAFQVGNVTAQTGHSIAFSLSLSGIGTLFELNSRGFLGLGVGVVNNGAGKNVNDWFVRRLFNVDAYGLSIIEGTIRHQQIYTGSESGAALWAMGPATNFVDYSFDRTDAEILGGGNMLYTTAVTSFHPAIATTIGQVDANQYIGIFSSKATLLDTSKTPNDANPIVLSEAPAGIFILMAMNSYANQAGGTAAISQSSLGIATTAYVDGTTIVRDPAGSLRLGSAQVGPDRALKIGAAGLALEPTSRAPSYAILNP